MHDYLSETEFAVRGLFDLIGNDDAILVEKKSKLDEAIKRRHHAQSILSSGPPMSGFGEDTAPYFEKKSRDARREMIKIEAEIVPLEAAVVAKEASVQAVAGAILQIAKQGISIVHGNLSNSPPGRSIGREYLKNVIWQARNQSTHWETNDPLPQAIKCFSNLEADFGSEFHVPPVTPQSLSKQVFRLLRWNNYETYELDLFSLLG